VSAWGMQGWTRRARCWESRVVMLLRAANAMAGLGPGSVAWRRRRTAGGGPGGLS
jgi:hypothetical protein